MSLALGRETTEMVPVGPVDMADVPIIGPQCEPLNIQTDKDRSSNRDRSCYPSGREKTTTENLWVSTAFRYQPRQQQLQLQRPPRLPFAVLDVGAAAAAAVAEVAAGAVEVVAAAVVVAVAEHVLGLGRRESAASDHGNHDRDGSAWWPPTFDCCEDLAGWGSLPNLLGRFGGTAVRPRNTLASMMEAVHFGGLRCIFAAWDAAGQTQRRTTYRPCSAPAPTACPQPLPPPPQPVEAALATWAPSYPETDGDKPDRILGSPRPKALAAVGCRPTTGDDDDTAPPRLPTDRGEGRCCLRWSSKTNLRLMFFHW